jgi:hypothetical protein
MTTQAESNFNTIAAGNNATFDILEDGVTYTFKNPNVRDSISVGMASARLRTTFELDKETKRPFQVTVDSSSLDDITSFMVDGMAILQVLLVKTSKTVNIDELPPETVISIYTGYLKQKEFFRNPNAGEPDGDIQPPQS